MRKAPVWIVTVVAALAASGPAAAQPFDGFYLGGNAGAAFGRANLQTTTVFSATGYFATSSVPAIAAAGDQSASDAHFTGGFFAGFNASFGPVLVGGEAEIGTMALEGADSATAVYPCCATTGFTIQQRFHTDRVFTVRPRVGYTLGPVLLYLSGGGALTRIDYRARFTDTFANATESSDWHRLKWGFAYGGGAEYKVGPRVALRAELLRLTFGKSEETSTNFAAFTPAIAFPSNVFTHAVDLSASVLRIGAAYYF